MYLLVFAAGLYADYATKAWVTAHMATDSHGQLVAARPGDAGRAVAEVVEARTGVGVQTLEDSEAEGRRPLMRLDTTRGVQTDERAFLRPGSAYWVVSAGSARRLPALNDVAQDVERHLDATVADYVAAKLPFLSAKELELALANTYAVDYTRVRLTDRVRGDEQWLLLDRQLQPLGDWLSIVYAENPGAAWGLFDGAAPALRRGGLLLSAALASSVIGVLLWRLRRANTSTRLALWLVLSGAAGNALDRWTLGYVVDFVDVALWGVHWPTFNVADVLISAGAGLLLLDLARYRRTSLLLGGSAGVLARETAPQPRALDPDRV